MADALTPTTELEAVNAMLDTIGEMPVNSLEVTGVEDLATAKRLLRSVNRAVQTRQWSFNSETEYELMRDQDNKIPVPANALFVDASDSENADVVVRGGFLYDRRKHTFVFDRSLKCDITFFLPFEDLPEYARLYITVRASRAFQQKVLGSEAKDKFTQEDELQAWASFNEAEARAADLNVLNQSNAAARVLQRNIDQ